MNDPRWAPEMAALEPTPPHIARKYRTGDGREFGVVLAIPPEFEAMRGAVLEAAIDRDFESAKARFCAQHEIDPDRVTFVGESRRPAPAG